MQQLKSEQISKQEENELDQIDNMDGNGFELSQVGADVHTSVPERVQRAITLEQNQQQQVGDLALQAGKIGQMVQTDDILKKKLARLKQI